MAHQEQNFKNFILSLLERADVNLEYRLIFTDDECMAIFRRAFTHESMDIRNNYQELEFIGDGILKGILSQYIPRRFENKKKIIDKPAELEMSGKKGKETKEGYYTQIRRHIEQKTYISSLSKKLQFTPFIIADEKTLSMDINSTHEDIFESFIGALVTVVDLKTRRGLGYIYAYNFVESVLNQEEIIITDTLLKDDKTRLTELYKATGDKTVSGKALRWGDAVFGKNILYLPKVNTINELPNNANPGTIYFVIEKRTGYIYKNKNWMILNDPRIVYTDIKKQLEKADDSEGVQHLVHSYLWGFPFNSQAPTLTPEQRKDFKHDPQKFGAIVISQGFDLQDKTSEARASKQALRLLEQRGYQLKSDI